MKSSAHLQDTHNQYHVTLSTNNNAHTIAIPPKASGYVSSTNGGELLLLALALGFNAGAVNR